MAEEMQQEESAEDRANLEVVLNNASLTYDAVTEKIANSKDPVMMAGQLAGMVFRSMITSANKEGKAINQNVSTKAMKTLTEDFIEIGVKIGAIKVQNQKDLGQKLKRAFKFAMKYYVDDEMSGRSANEANAMAAQQVNPSGGQSLQQEPLPPQSQAPSGGVLNSMMGG